MPERPFYLAYPIPYNPQSDEGEGRFFHQSRDEMVRGRGIASVRARAMAIDQRRCQPGLEIPPEIRFRYPPVRENLSRHKTGSSE